MRSRRDGYESEGRQLPRRVRHIAASAATASAVILFAQACNLAGGGPCPEDPCPEPFNVGAWCDRTSSCTVDGVLCKSPCKLYPGEVLTIAVDGLWDDPRPGGRDLHITEGGCAEGSGESLREIEVTLDGVPAELEVTAEERIWVWESPPEAPQYLQLRYRSPGDPGCLDLYMSLVDGRCELDTPEPSCPM